MRVIESKQKNVFLISTQSHFGHYTDYNGEPADLILISDKNRISYKTYADDTKMYAKVNSIDDSKVLQRAIDDFYEWTKSFDLRLSVEKCLVMHCGKKKQER